MPRIPFEDRKNKERRTTGVMVHGDQLDDQQKAVIEHFVQHGSYSDAMKAVYGDKVFKDSVIDNRAKAFFSNVLVREYMDSLFPTLDTYDNMVDDTLVKLILSDKVSAKDKITATKVYNDLRQRVVNKLKLEQDINFGSLSDEDLNSIINKLKE